VSARNGDKSRFNRERKQKIARRKRTHELLERAAKARKSADTTVRAHPIESGREAIVRELALRAAEKRRQSFGSGLIVWCAIWELENRQFVSRGESYSEPR